MSCNDNNNNVRDVLRPVEDFITRSHAEFNEAIHKVLLPSLMNSSFALHSLKENLNDSIYEYGEQRFRDGVRSVESGESRIQLDVVQPSPAHLSESKSSEPGLSCKSENIKHARREEMVDDGKSNMIKTLTEKLVAAQKRVNELQTIINEKEQENKANAASAAKCVQLWKENGQLLEKCETIAREVDAMKAENDELKKEKSKTKILVVEEEAEPASYAGSSEEEEEDEEEAEPESEVESEAKEEEGGETAPHAESEEEEEEEEGGESAPHAESGEEEEEEVEVEEEEEAEEWLHYSIEFLSTVYSPWGDTEGGWAEGPHYWMTGMAYLIEAANLLRSATGIDLYERPFFQTTGDFPLYTKAPETRRATFGDDATQGDRLCIKMGYNVRQFAGVTGNPAYQWYFETVRANDTGTEKEFYNWGWWDLNFDDLVYHHDFPAVDAAPPLLPKLKHFKGTGWACIQHRMDDPAEHIQFNFKSSPFGSISHSHGDQNAFCLHAFGEDLCVNSGYYVAFNSTMHRNWRRQTRSKNAVLIDGKGQYADMDKALAARATGSIERAEDRGDHVYISGDATNAYAVINPDVTLARREVYFVQDRFFVFVDTVDAKTPVSLDFLLHTEKPMTLGATSFRYTGQNAGFYGQLLWSESGPASFSQNTQFIDVDPDDYAGLPVSTCMSMSFPKAIRHRAVTLLVPYSLAAPRRVFSFLDDQGYDCDIYFTDSEDRSFKITVPKSFDTGAEK